MLWSSGPCLTLSFVFLHGPKIALLLFSATYCLCGGVLKNNITLQQDGDKEDVAKEIICGPEAI